jgi:dTDP-4-amino-4,6-dideoxygalactose transaminase
MLSRGDQMLKMEQDLAAYLNKKYALFTGNGTQAQMLILKSLGIGPGDEVILPTYVCDKVWKGVTAIGANPVLCDVGENGVMSSAEIAPKITIKTKAIILVHIFGINAWTEDLSAFNIPIIEDICQSFGSIKYENRTGTFTSYAFTSFHGTKALGLGEGGMLFVNDEAQFEEIKRLKANLGFVTSGTEITAAMGNAQLGRYQIGLERRKEIAMDYLHSIPKELNTWANAIVGKSMHFRYVLKSNKDWETIRKKYLEQGIHVRKGVDALLHRQYGLSDENFPTAAQLFTQAVSIPILPQLTTEESERIVKATKLLFKQGIV